MQAVIRYSCTLRTSFMSSKRRLFWKWQICLLRFAFNGFEKIHTHCEKDNKFKGRDSTVKKYKHMHQKIWKTFISNKRRIFLDVRKPTTYAVPFSIGKPKFQLVYLACGLSTWLIVCKRYWSIADDHRWKFETPPAFFWGRWENS